MRSRLLQVWVMTDGYRLPGIPGQDQVKTRELCEFDLEDLDRSDAAWAIFLHINLKTSLSVAIAML
jgi:hypothetical protein